MEWHMAMTKQLWSISGLAVELGKDRRTIAKALSSVAADGHIAGEKAWHMTTALTALSGERRTPDPTQENNDIVLTLLDRLDHWPQLHSSELSSLTLSVSEFADLARQTPENILDCLRAGMPFVEEGDWRTG